MEQLKKTISLVIPVYNEELNIRPLYNVICNAISGLEENYNFEFIFTDNHSTDKSFSELERLFNLDKRIRVFRFSRNFGYQKSILTGYLQATGDAIVQLDCDLQDPPSMIAEFIECWENGYSVVYGVRETRKENLGINLMRKAFYRFINYLSEDDLPVDAGDFRLIDKKIANVLRQIDDAQPYLRGAIAVMGFNQIGIPYNRNDRKLGSTNFKFKDLISLAIDGVLNHSIVPLRIASFFGIIASIASLILISFYTAGKFIFGYDWPPGFTTLAVMILCGIAINALFLGILGEYIGRIYKQVKKKPLVIIEKTLDGISK
jgi:glycosyltransferase involved in cell wall biosynthesis